MSQVTRCEGRKADTQFSATDGAAFAVVRIDDSGRLRYPNLPETAALAQEAAGKQITTIEATIRSRKPPR